MAGVGECAVLFEFSLRVLNFFREFLVFFSRRASFASATALVVCSSPLLASATLPAASLLASATFQPSLLASATFAAAVFVA